MYPKEDHTSFIPESGSNQSGLRDRNARLVLSLIRRHGQIASAEIARASGLSAQTVSNICRALEAGGLIRRGEAVRGRVGKPSVPVSLNPDGVHSLGLNIGRRSSELVLVDFEGRMVADRAATYPYPTCRRVAEFLTRGSADIFAAHPKARDSLAGLGISAPFGIWEWLEIVNAPAAEMEEWRSLDLAAWAGGLTGHDVYSGNDATSACIAEHLLGLGRDYGDFAYIYIGAFVGGGLVLGGKVVSGPTGNAAAFGPMPVPTRDGGTTPLLNVASLHVLESALARAGRDPLGLRDSPLDWSAFEPEVSEWIAATGDNLALASAAAASVVELEAVVIDGAMPDATCNALVQRAARALAKLDLTGIRPPDIRRGAVGRAARSIGAALLPIHARFFLV